MEEVEANYFLKIENQVYKFNLLGDKHNACTKESQTPDISEPKGPKHEDPNLITTEIVKLINKLYQEKLDIIHKQEIEGYRNYISYELQALYHREAQIVHKMTQNWKKLDIFKSFLDKLNLANNYEGESTQSDLSREEVDKHKLHFRIRHGTTNSLVKEKQLFKRIKAGQQMDVVDYSSRKDGVNNLKLHFHIRDGSTSSLGREKQPCKKKAGQRQVVVDYYSSRKEEINNSSLLYRQMRCEKIYREGANDRLKEIIEQHEWCLKNTITQAIVQRKTQNNLNSNKKAIRDEMKVLCYELEELRKRKMGLGEEIGCLKRKLKNVEKEISSISKKQGLDINKYQKKRKEAYEYLLKLMKQRDTTS
ncbi:hypothetical protein PanWU01x14_071670 [Parasponia andersonii]|uniref:Proton pump-interactor n=1 Tax=Parasponia andersonii TaxID=3476 RepID=A0A2P5DEK1_PARAD|nr:hypothetical protein PanWU01x14_071670 [Parasponia andersonii]